MRKTILMVGIAICIICAAFIFGVFFAQRDAIHSQDLTLSDYPKVFAKEAVIVIGENASLIEIESAEAITANLENLTGNKPEIVSSEKFDSFKYTHNLILLGTPNSNVVLEEVYNMTNATRVTEGYPGENKGILEILRNPWNEEKAMLLVEGSNEWGVKVGCAKLATSEIYPWKKVMITDTLIELGGTIRPVPQYVFLPVTLPIDTKEEASVIAKACLERAIFKNQPVKIVEGEDAWYLEGPKRQGLDYPFWSMTINRTTGKTEYVAVK
jgi:hypothetical protein